MTKISSLLNRGGIAATSATDITALTGLDAREIRHAVQNERQSGTVILSDERGYFPPSEDHETAVYETMEWLGRMGATVRSYEMIIRNAQAYLESLGVKRE